MMPILGALILQAAYGAVDLLVVGRFGTTADYQPYRQAADIKSGYFCDHTVCNGITVLIARYIGEKALDRSVNYLVEQLRFLRSSVWYFLS